MRVMQGSLHVPSQVFSSRVSELADEFGQKPFVVFHCMQSKQRGPMCARLFHAELVHRGYPAQNVFVGTLTSLRLIMTAAHLFGSFGSCV